VQLAALGARAETVAASVTLKTGGAFSTARKKTREGLVEVTSVRAQLVEAQRNAHVL
jgi:hypothetical protein